VIFNNSFSQNLNRAIMLDDASGCSRGGTYPLQHQIREVYLWGNVLNEGGAASIKVDTGCGSFVQHERDYFLSPRSGYTPYTYPHPLQGTLDIASNLEMHLTFDEGTDTTAADATGHGHTGTLSTGATWGPGKVGPHAVQVDGTTQGVVTVAGELGTPAAITLAAWVKVDAFPTAKADILSIGDHVILRASATQITGFYYNGNERSWPSVSVELPLGTTWRHLAYTAQAGTQHLYLDGTQVGSSTSGAALDYDGLGTQTVVGGHGNGVDRYRFQGSVDEVRVYSRVLTPTEIAALAASPEAGPLGLRRPSLSSPTLSSTSRPQ
jgi:hypothetical protein